MGRLCALALVALAPVGCASDATKIVGVWWGSDMTSPLKSELILARDGTYSYRTAPRNVDNPRIAESRGTYEVRADVLILSGPGLPPFWERLKIAVLTDTDLLLESTAGRLTVIGFKRATK